VRRRLLLWLAGITGEALQDMLIPTGVTDGLHTIGVTIDRVRSITPTRRGVLSGSDIATRSRLRLEQAVALALEHCSAEGEERGLALSLG